MPRLLLSAGSFQDWEPGEEEIQQESRDACAHMLLPEHAVLLAHSSHCTEFTADTRAGTRYTLIPSL